MQGKQQCSDASSSDSMELPIVLRKGTREAAKKALPLDIFDDHEIGSFVPYEDLSLSCRVFCLSLQTMTIPKDWMAGKQDRKWHETMIEELEALKKNKTHHIAGRKERSEFVSGSIP